MFVFFIFYFVRPLILSESQNNATNDDQNNWDEFGQEDENLQSQVDDDPAEDLNSSFVEHNQSPSSPQEFSEISEQEQSILTPVSVNYENGFGAAASETRDDGSNESFSTINSDSLLYKAIAADALLGDHVEKFKRCHLTLEDVQCSEPDELFELVKEGLGFRNLLAKKICSRLREICGAEDQSEPSSKRSRI